MRLRYTGGGPTCFLAAGIEVGPGAEFDVPDDVATALTARPDIEVIETPAAKTKTTTTAPSAAQ